MIAQDKNQILYFANNEDYLSLWLLLALISHQTKLLFVLLKLLAIRFTVVVIWNLVIGIVKDGLLKYSSLSKAIKSKLLDDEQF
jgi:hypothetical protein